ncbi:hypothetical protein [Conexibacter arvalis]|uniref:Uncharacterized protein n=1 Tax=Conexibacter arvalis TaxID=912552 RepID=A0A840IFX0_9ACTN|nr:hypothetical protein [Conexibacter arvalis]MBB4663762.1 hypothetical protein [Conexibacter arvalis]
MLTATNLFDEIEARDEPALAQMLADAVAHGAELTGDAVAVERRRGSDALMCAAGELLLEVALLAQALQSQAPRLVRPRHPHLVESLELLRDTSGASARLLWHALEARAFRGEELEAERGGAVRVAGAVLRDGCHPLGLPPRPPVSIARAAASELFRAIGAMREDAVMVPVHLSASLGYVVALYALAVTLLERGEPA